MSPPPTCSAPLHPLRSGTVQQNILELACSLCRQELARWQRQAPPPPILVALLALIAEVGHPALGRAAMPSRRLLLGVEGCFWCSGGSGTLRAAGRLEVETGEKEWNKREQWRPQLSLPPPLLCRRGSRAVRRAGP